MNDDRAGRAQHRYHRAMLGTVLALALLSTAVGTSWPPLERFDHWLSAQAFGGTYGHETRVAVWTVVTNVGGPNPMRAVLVVAGVIGLVRRRVPVGVWLIALAVLEAVVAPASKLVLERPRPTWADPITVLASSSYPSGHATAVATAAVAVALVVRRWAVSLACLVVAVAVAASRVLLGVHYPSDVIGGLLLGALLAFASHGVLTVVVTRRVGSRASAREDRADAGATISPGS